MKRKKDLPDVLTVGIFILSLIGFGFIFLLGVAAICNWIQHDSATDIGHWVKQFNEAAK